MGKDNINLIEEYKKLDPNGEFFKTNIISWDNELNEPIRVEFIKHTPFTALLGNRDNVPIIDKYYNPSKTQLRSIHAAMITKQNIAFTGPPGTGKTSIIEYVAAMTNRPFYVADIHEEFRPEHFDGEYRPVGNKEIKWFDGALTKAFRSKGAIFLMDEANFAFPSVLAKAHRALAGNNIILQENNLEIIPKSPGVLLTMACNALNNVDQAQNHTGIKPMNKAFMDRFGIVVQTSYLQIEDEVSIILDRIKGIFTDIYALLYKKGVSKIVHKMCIVAGRVRTAIETGEISVNFSLRTTTSWALQYCYFRDLTKATEISILDKEEIEDAIALDAIIKTEFGTSYTSLFDTEGNRIVTVDVNKDKQKDTDVKSFM